MRVLMLGNWPHGGFMDGLENHDINIYTALNRLPGVEVKFMAFDEKGLEWSERQRFRYKLSHNLPLAFILRVSKEAKSWRPDIIHVQGCALSPYTQFMVLTPSAAGKVMTIHGVSSEEARAGNYGLIPRILTPLYILIEELTLRKADRLILVNENKTAWIRSHFGDRTLAKTVVVQNGVDLGGVRAAKADIKEVERSRMEMGAAADDFLIFMAKGFVTINGHEYLIRALPFMKARGLKVHLALAGDGTLHPVMKALAAELGVANDVTFMGTVTNSQALSAEAAADVIVLPSIRTGSTEEGSSIFLLESMAMAKPIVATAVGGNLTCIQDRVNGILVPERDPQAIADAVVDLKNDPELRQQISRNAELDAESKWTWNETAKKVLVLYSSLLTERKPT